MTTPERDLQQEFKASLVDLTDTRSSNGDGGADDDDDDDHFGDGRFEAEFDDDLDHDPDDDAHDDNADMVDADDGRADMADDDDFDDDPAGSADGDEVDDDQAEMIDDDENGNEDRGMAESERADDDDDDRDARRPSVVSKTRSSTSTKEPKRRAPIMSPQLADGVRYLLNRYELAHSTSVPQNLAVVSALSGEGVTTVSQALAEVLAVDFSVSVCWVDFSWTSTRRNPPRNGARSDPGLYEVLRGDADLDDVIVSTSGSPVAYLPSGDVADEDRHAMVRWPHLSDTIADLRSMFDHVVFDSAPLLANSDALALLRYVDAHLLVTKHGSTTMRQVKATAAELETIPSLGALLNKYNPSTPSFIRRLFSE